MVLRSGIIGVSMSPFGDLSGDGDVMVAIVAFFLFSKSIGVVFRRRMTVGMKGECVYYMNWACVVWAVLRFNSILPIFGLLYLYFVFIK